MRRLAGILGTAVLVLLATVPLAAATPEADVRLLGHGSCTETNEGEFAQTDGDGTYAYTDNRTRTSSCKPGVELADVTVRDGETELARAYAGSGGSEAGTRSYDEEGSSAWGACADDPTAVCEEGGVRWNNTSSSETRRQSMKAGASAGGQAIESRNGYNDRHGEAAYRGEGTYAYRQNANGTAWTYDDHYVYSSESRSNETSGYRTSATTSAGDVSVTPTSCESHWTGSSSSDDRIHADQDDASIEGEWREENHHARECRYGPTLETPAGAAGANLVTSSRSSCSTYNDVSSCESTSERYLEVAAMETQTRIMLP